MLAERTAFQGMGPGQAAFLSSLTVLAAVHNRAPPSPTHECAVMRFRAGWGVRSRAPARGVAG